MLRFSATDNYSNKNLIEHVSSGKIVEDGIDATLVIRWHKIFSNMKQYKEKFADETYIDCYVCHGIYHEHYARILFCR